MFFSKTTSACLIISALLLGSPVWARTFCSNSIVNNRPNEPQSYGKQLMDIIRISYPNEQQSTQFYYEIQGSLLNNCQNRISYCRKLLSTLLDSENDYPKNDFFYTEDLDYMESYLDSLRDYLENELFNDYRRAIKDSAVLSSIHVLDDDYFNWADNVNMEPLLSKIIYDLSFHRSRCLAYE